MRSVCDEIDARCELWAEGGRRKERGKREVEKAEAVSSCTSDDGMNKDARRSSSGSLQSFHHISLLDLSKQFGVAEALKQQIEVGEILQEELNYMWETSRQ